MKDIRVGFFVLLFAGAVFGDSFEITSYAPDKGLVEIITGAIRTNRPFISFGTDEQKKIVAWLKDDAFLNAGADVEIEEKSAPGGTPDIKSDVWHYITIKNCSDVDLEGVKLEGATFFETHDDKMKLELGRYVLTTQTIDIPAGTTYSYQTKKIGLRDACETEEVRSENINTGAEICSTYKYHSKDRLLGFYLRLSKTDRHGDVVALEHHAGRLPPQKKWKTFLECSPEEGLAPPEGLLGADIVASYEDGLEKETSRKRQWAWIRAYEISKHYSVLHDVKKTTAWAAASRKLYSEHSSPLERSGYDLSDLDRFVQTASSYQFPSFFDR
jgi:hypothetical protein